MLGMLRRLVGLSVENIFEGCYEPSFSSKSSQIRVNYNFVAVWDVKDHDPISELDISNAFLLLYSDGLFKGLCW
jgi:hypothetical protein